MLSQRNTTASWTLRSVLLAAIPLAAANPLNFAFPSSATSPVPFVASVDPAFIEETLQKARRYMPSIDLLDAAESNAGWLEGPPRENMTALAGFWAEEYEWFQTQDEINNNLSHYAVTIPSGAHYEHPIPLHFVHERSAAEDAIPLLLLHGWPSTHLEWSKVIGPLVAPTDTAAQAFHVVAPDLPGFGFSPAPMYSGLGARQMGAAFDQLMRQLWYSSYGVISTDLGWYVGLFLTDLVPDSIIGHLSDFWIIPPNATDLERLAQNQTTEQETRYITALRAWKSNHFGYATVHAQLPLALGQALTDTPVGFAGWVWELMHIVGDGYAYSLDEVITSAMMLFIQGTWGKLRAYKEALKDGENLPITKVPTGATQWGFPNGDFKDIQYFYDVPRDWLERLVNLVYLSTHEGGGHFPALSQPELWVQDVQMFFGNLTNKT
ncbi:Uu.00g122010.m01.CDS01 [Anthostomella pinea]|uniref:Uu.00g122010.m01.CDS01 n=1 Tax=Anthostomella pinea TaxID=933095 RepID=A0AAI8VBV5_9PEZI|nr:Uu.00g122010.m01.CDS01 [Anthostomella pinea]